MNSYPGYVDVRKAHSILRSLREFFYIRGYSESIPQGRRHILPACESSENITTYIIGEEIYPMIQTGQMGLEDDLLYDNSLERVFCLTTSYRDEKNPKPRHQLTFPLFEFESLGNYDDLLNLCKDMIRHLGYTGLIVEIDYNDACKRYGVDELEHEHEEMLCQELSPVVFLKKFPVKTHPFWNMKLDGDLSYKLDVIMAGIETIGSAERECDVNRMRSRFYEVSNGEYAAKLFELFGQERVEKELETFLKHKFVSRFGGGIGLTRLINFMEKFVW